MVGSDQLVRHCWPGKKFRPSSDRALGNKSKMDFSELLAAPSSERKHLPVYSRPAVTRQPSSGRLAGMKVADVFRATPIRGPDTHASTCVCPPAVEASASIQVTTCLVPAHCFNFLYHLSPSLSSPPPVSRRIRRGR